MKSCLIRLCVTQHPPDAERYSATWDLAWKLGVRKVWANGSFVTGEVRLPRASQASIDARSYVWPSDATTGSSMRACVETNY